VNAAEARRRFAEAHVARMATVGAEGHPHLVVITFALLGRDTIVSAIDHKPKRTVRLKRLANITAHPAVSLLADHYEEDWSALWWTRADGHARVVAPREEPELRGAALEALADRYPQYRERPPEGALIVVEVTGWSGWTG
jgi:PPOX class probable F420-dependent enzyme